MVISCDDKRAHTRQTHAVVLLPWWNSAAPSSPSPVETGCTSGPSQPNRTGRSLGRDSTDRGRPAENRTEREEDKKVLKLTMLRPESWQLYNDTLQIIPLIRAFREEKGRGEKRNLLMLNQLERKSLQTPETIGLLTGWRGKLRTIDFTTFNLRHLLLFHKQMRLNEIPALWQYRMLSNLWVSSERFARRFIHFSYMVQPELKKLHLIFIYN